LNETLESHESQAPPLLSLGFLCRAISIPSALTRYLPFRTVFNLLSWFRRQKSSPQTPKPAPLDKPIPHSNSPPEQSQLSVSLPPTLDQTSHAGSQHLLPGNPTATGKEVASQPEASQPTPEVRLAAALLKHIDTEELAECIHQNFRESGIQLLILSNLLSTEKLEHILLSYRHIITQKLEQMLAAQNINKFFLEQMASFFENWSPGATASHLPSDIKTSPDK